MKHKNKQKPWPMTPPPPSAAAAVACANLTTFEPRAATPNAKMPTPQLSRLADLTDHDAIDEEMRRRVATWIWKAHGVRVGRWWMARVGEATPGRGAGIDCTIPGGGLSIVLEGLSRVGRYSLEGHGVQNGGVV